MKCVYDQEAKFVLQVGITWLAHYFMLNVDGQIGDIVSK